MSATAGQRDEMAVDIGSSPSMASGNADRVVMAAVPGFGFPVDAPNVATPRQLRDEKAQNGTLVRSSQCIRETFTCCLPVNTNDTARTGNQDETKHNGCQTTRLNTQR